MQMAGRLTFALLLLLPAAALAGTYKWVDAKGVVNYSNAPPPGKAAGAQLVEERISVVGADPSVAWAAAAMRERAARRAQYEEADWQRRRSLLLAAQPGIPADYAMGYGPVPAFYYPYSYGGAVFTAGVPRRPSPFFMHGSFPSGARGAMRSARGSFR
jgi:hypothetical protein